ARPLPRMTCATESTREGAMRQSHYTLTPAAVRAHAQLLCQRHLRLRDHGPKCTAGVLWALLFYAAARICSLAAACRSLRDAPSRPPAPAPSPPPPPHPPPAPPRGRTAPPHLSSRPA